jgi:hypothetical protein
MSAETASDDVTLASSGTVPEHTQIVVQVHWTAALPWRKVPYYMCSLIQPPYNPPYK